MIINSLIIINEVFIIKLGNISNSDNNNNANLELLGIKTERAVAMEI